MAVKFLVRNFHAEVWSKLPYYHVNMVICKKRKGDIGDIMSKIGESIESVTLKDFLSQVQGEEINIFRTARAVNLAVVEGRLEFEDGEILKEILSRPGEIAAVYERPRKKRRKEMMDKRLLFLCGSPRLWGY